MATRTAASSPKEPVGSVGIANGDGDSSAVPDMVIANESLSIPMVVLVDFAPAETGWNV